MDIVPEITRRSITRLINDGKRADGRAFDERRDIFKKANNLNVKYEIASRRAGDIAECFAFMCSLRHNPKNSLKIIEEGFSKK